MQWMVSIIMKELKSEHYVPRFYLGSFAIRNERKSLYCFDKTTSKEFISKIENIAREKCFYDITLSDKTIEKALARLESGFGAVYNKLITAQDLNRLNLKERVFMAIFVATQELRTKEWRETLKDLCNQLKERLSKYKLSEKLEKEMKEIFKEDYCREFQLHMLKEVPQFAETMLGMKWIMVVNGTNMSFWTSDHPVNRYNPIDKSPLGNLGLLCDGIQMFFPLTPRLALCICDPFQYFPYPEKITTKNVDNVIFQNHLQMQWATRLIFSQDSDFSLAMQILKEQPSLTDVNKKRISII